MSKVAGLEGKIEEIMKRINGIDLAGLKDTILALLSEKEEKDKSTRLLERIAQLEYHIQFVYQQIDSKKQEVKEL